MTSRNAILAPVYNEQPGPVFARLQVMIESLVEQGAAGRFDLFVLSDTRDPVIASLEREHHRALQARFVGIARIFYRRRAVNTDRKAGNIAEWVRRFGGAYDHMIVLDADSLMSGDALARLATAMEGAPGCGLIQTVPTIVNGRTLFARTEQFASRLYGPMFARGLAWWSGSESSYWGHNAIIRVAAFAEQAGLPHLRGPRPFGGHIMSHDFVEAALMRRGGWEIRLAPEIGGSYEEGPPTLVDQIVRDRRWCQGNLQHIGVLSAKGLHPLSRFHLLRGFSTYLTAPLWLGLLTIGLLLACFPGLGGAAPSGGLPYGAAALWAVFGASLAFLLAPKLMAVALVVREGAARGFGGAGRLLAGVAVEVVVSSLTAPIVLLAQTAAILQIVSGQDSGWAAQRRDAARLSLRGALRLHTVEALLGLTLLTLCLVFEPAALPWVAVPAVALLVAFALSALTARRGVSTTGSSPMTARARRRIAGGLRISGVVSKPRSPIGRAVSADSAKATS
ncbi:MAG: glucans biosynthesis glucosyltransferase MdoH, partial [Rubrivivax sp.]